MARGFRLVARGEGDCKKRYRPQRLSEICPTFPMLEALAILGNPNASQVWLFEGLTGCGKTTLARIIARACICQSTDPKVEKPCLECDRCKAMESAMDFTEINVAQFGGKEAVKNKIADMCYMPGDLGRKIYIFDEAHQLTPASQELMNKVLEEPIGDTLIFLCTTRRKGLKRTLLGRCANLNFRRVTRAQFKKIVSQICKDAGTAPPNDDTSDSLFHKADGSVRDLLNLMDKFLLGAYELGIGFDSSDEDHGAPNLFKFIGALKDKDWAAVREILRTDNIKNEPEGYRQTVCDFLRRDILKNKAIDLRAAFALGLLAGSLEDEPKPEQYNLFVLKCMRVCYKK